MLNPITYVHNKIMNADIEDPKFLNVLIFPGVGLIVQVYRNIATLFIIRSYKLGEVEILSSEGRVRYNKCTNKIQELLKTDELISKKAKWVLIAFAIIAFVVFNNSYSLLALSINPYGIVAGCVIISIGCLYYSTRKIIHLINLRLEEHYFRKATNEQGYIPAGYNGSIH